MSLQIFGLAVSRGVAIGRAVLVASSRVDVDHYFVEGPAIDAELVRLETARVTVEGEFEALKRDRSLVHYLPRATDASVNKWCSVVPRHP